MTPEKQRIAIAEACGIKETKTTISWIAGGQKNSIPAWVCFDAKGKATHTSSEKSFWTPDYINDLNAMHEAEKMLTAEQASNYGTFIRHLVEQYTVGAEYSPYEWNATASQKAEAFLRTIGKWRDQ